MATLVASYAEAARFQPGRFTPIRLGDNERVRALLTCFEPGQFIPVHAPGVDMTLAILEGEATVVAGDHEMKVGPGAIAFVPAGERRGVRAETRVVALHVVTPPPADADHERVVAGLERGSWR